MSKGYYLAFDVDRIQDSIFESNVLPVVRGGSLRLRYLTSEDQIGEQLRELAKDHCEPEVVFADGGSGLIELPGVEREHAEMIAARLESWFASKSAFSSLTTATLPMEGGAAATNIQSARVRTLPRFGPLPTLPSRAPSDC